MEIRIFISSPGDVVAERAIAKRVIRKLQKELGNAVELKPLLWEDMPLQSTSTFQEGIDKIVNTGLIDIAIFILWSRLGSPLGHKFQRPDGTFYRSGTEYEYEMMLTANKQTGKPEILAYIKNAPVTKVLAGMNDLSTIEEWTEQNKRVQQFIKENFYDKESHTVYGAYHQFDESVSFEQKLTEHLRRLVIGRIGQVKEVEWNGNPYMGLKSFEFEDEAIFYGRRRVINEIEEQLIAEYRDKGAASLILLGESGSGKSSLVKAGLLPDLADSGIAGEARWSLFTVTPGQFGGAVFPGIVDLVGQAIPALKGSRIWEDVRYGIEINYAYLADFFEHLTEQNGNKQVTLFFFDQFEELFTDPLITEEMRCKVIALLQGLVETHKIWFIFSIRSDFYHKFIGYPQLLELKKHSFVYDLPVMLHSELQEIVEEPAKKAALKWEIDAHTGNSLKSLIINDIAAHSSDLPLIEFALSELYTYRNEKNELTFGAYEKIGRIEGAIVNYVDKLYAGLTGEEKEIFEHLLSAIITESASNKDIYVRRGAQLAELEKNENYRKLIAKLVKTHLFVTGKDVNGRPTLTIAHEMLIHSWKVISEWIGKEKNFIRLNEYYENCGNYWKEASYAPANLIRDKVSIREAEFFLLHWETNISELTSAFLKRSIKRFYRKHYALYISAFAFLVFSLLSLWLSIELNNPFIKDFIEDDFTWSSSIMLYGLLLLFLGYKIWLKKKALPLYKTVRISLVFFSLMVLLALIETIRIIYNMTLALTDRQDVVEAIGEGSYLLLPIVVFSYFLQVFFDFRNVENWKKRIFSKSVKTSRIIRKVTAFFSYMLVSCLIIGAMAIWGMMINEKQEKLVQSYEIIDELFDGLNNLQGKLTSSDVIYVNNKRLNYLWENFRDELMDTIQDRRDYQYALCQYNLARPDRVIGNLDFDYFTDMRLGILTYSELGNTGLVELLLDRYKDGLMRTEGHTLNEIDVPMIWAAEKVGMFGFVKQLYDTVQYDLEANSALRINYAHALLMTGSFQQAINEYATLLEDTSLPYEKELVKDFSVLRWSGVSGDTIALAEKALKLPVRKINTTPADDEATPGLAAPFVGRWRYEANQLYYEMEVTAGIYNLCFYSVKDTLGNELWCGVTRFRMKKEGDKLICEELDTRQNELGIGEWQSVDQNELRIKIWDNGNPEEAGTVRIYRRLNEEG